MTPPPNPTGAQALVLSDRVREFRATAVRVAVDRVLGVAISDQDAWQLAGFGSLEEIIRALRSRLRVERSLGSPADDREFQTGLAVLEVMVEAHAGHRLSGTEILQVYRRALDERRSQLEEARFAEERSEQLKELISRARGTNDQLRRFLSRVERVRGQHRRILIERILNEADCRAACLMLDELTATYLQRALQVAG